MKVIVAESAGFCMGVRRAVEKARATVAAVGAPVHTDGPLIHNRQMTAELDAMGVHECGDPRTLTGGTLLVRAHGIPPERRTALQALPLKLVDATCPDVARIQGIIRKHARSGRTVLIYGDPGHAEVLGLLGYAEGRGHVVTSPDDVRALRHVGGPVLLVAQSTQFPFAYERIAAAARETFADVRVEDTICESTRRRQSELADIATRVDAIVVAGGLHSANTLRLVELARSLRPTYHVETAADLPCAELARHRTVGLTAGASTPDFVIADIRRVLETLQPTDP